MKRLNFYIVFLFALHVVIGTASCNNKEKTDHTAHDQEKDVYTCPMHPEIIRNAQDLALSAVWIW